jgi:hypothetical protein
VRGGRNGLAAVFSVGLRALDDSGETNVHPKYSWTDLYISLAIVDKSVARVPVGLLAILWEIAASVAETICMGFQDVALGHLEAGSCTAGGTFVMHDVQLAYAGWRSGSEGLICGQTTSGS